MLTFTIKLQKGGKIVLTPASQKSVSVSVYDKDGKLITFGYVGKDDLASFAKAL